MWHHKYVHFGGLPPILYDLDDDLGETVNRARDPAYGGVMQEMMQRMLTWRSRHEDQVLANTLIEEGGLQTSRGVRF